MTDTFEVPEGLPEGPWRVAGLDHDLEGWKVTDIGPTQDHDGDGASEYLATAYSEAVARAIASIPAMVEEIGRLRNDRDAYRRVTGQGTICPDAGTEIVERLYRQHFDDLPVGVALLMHDAGREIERLEAARAKLHQCTLDMQTEGLEHRKEADRLRAQNAEEAEFKMKAIGECVGLRAQNAELREAIEQALDDMRDGQCVCLATKELMQTAFTKSQEPSCEPQSSLRELDHLRAQNAEQAEEVGKLLDINGELALKMSREIDRFRARNAELQKALSKPDLWEVRVNNALAILTKQ